MDYPLHVRDVHISDPFILADPVTGVGGKANFRGFRETLKEEPVFSERTTQNTPKGKTP